MSQAPDPSGAPSPHGVADWALRALRSLTLQNLIMLGILVAIAVPSYFAWKFLTDAPFRHEFMSTATLVDADVPCEVVRGNLGGQVGDRHTMLLVYKTANRLDYLIALRSATLLTPSEIQTACRLAHDQADLILNAIEQQAELARERLRGEARHNGGTGQ